MKRFRIIALFLSLILLMAGCSARNLYSAETQEAPMAAPSAMDMPMDNSSAGWGGVEKEPFAEESGVDYTGTEAQSQKIIKNAGMGIETREFDLHVDYIRDKAVQLGGYVSSSSVSGKIPTKYNDYGRHASIVLRVPAERLEAFLSDARGLATVTYENQSGEDISRAYFDTESRMKIYTTQRDRIMALLEKAEAMEDIITLETELSRLTYEIEGLTSSLRNWDNLVSYSTINIEISEIAPSTPVVADDSMGFRMGEGFRKTLNSMSVFFENLLVFIVAASPVLVILAIIAVIIIVFARKAGAKQRARMEQMGFAPPTASVYGAGDAGKLKKRKSKHAKKAEPEEGQKQEE